MEFPDSDNFTVVHSGKLNVKANTEASRRFLSTAKKAEWKLRYAEIVIYTSIDGVDRYYILIYKLKKGDVKVPYLKLDINKDTEIQSFDLFGKFFFDLPSDHSASFSTEFSIDRDEWVQVIESCVSASRDGNSTKISPRKSFRADVPTKVTNTTTMSSQIANSNQEKSRSYNIPDDPTTPDSFVLAQNTTISSGNGYSESSTMSHMNDPHLSLISKTDSPVKSNEHSSVDKSNVRFFGSIDIKDGDGDDSSQGDTSSLSIGLKRPSINKNLSLHEQIGGLSTVPLRKSERKAHPDSVSRQIKNKGTVPLSLGSPQNETFGSTIDGQGLEISVCRSIADSSDIPTYPSTSDGIATSFSPPGQYNRRANAGLTPHRADQYDRSFTFDTAPSSGQYHPESMLMREIQALAAMNNELNDALEASVTERNEEREEFLKQITTLQTALEEAAVEKQVLLEKQNSYQNSIDVLNVSVSNTTELSQQLAESSELVDALRDRIRSFEGLESEIKFQAEEVSQLKNENSRLSEQCTTKDSTIAEQHEQIDAVEQSLDEMRKLLSKQDKQIATLSESEQQLREESEKYLAEVKELRDAIASNEWKLRADELALKFTNSENERQQATMELLAVKQTEESSRMSMVRLENLTKEQQSFIEDLNKQINALNDAKVQLADTHSQLILRSTELANAKKEIENLKGDLVGINALLFSTEERLKQEQEQRASDSAASSRELESTKLKLKQTEKDFINLVRSK